MKLTLTKAKILGAGILMAVLCVVAPKQLHAEVPEAQMDGVLGQSLTDETEYNTQPSSDSLCFQGLEIAPRETQLLKASAYSKNFIENSFTTFSDYTNSTYYHNAQFADTQILNGIDISWWQAKNKKTTAINWEKAHDAGIDFAFVRVASRDTSNGKIYEDTSANSHIQEALKNDVNIGLYVFSQALTVAEAKEEAEFALKLVDKYGWNVTLPIAIDREPGKNKRLTAGKLTKAKETAIDQAFVDTITDAGYQAALYTNFTWSRNYIDANKLENCTIWFARYNNTTTYNTKSGSAYADVPCDYEFWQYSSSGKVDGYSGNLDVSFWYKDTSEQTTGLKAARGTTGTVKLNWDEVSADDIDGYQVWRRSSDEEKYTLLKKTTDSSYTDTTVEGGNVYQYKVRCYWTLGGTPYYGTFSSAVSVMTQLPKVSGVNAQTRTATTLGLSWKQTSGAAGYQIYQYNAAKDQYEMAADVEGQTTSYTISGLSEATEYKFKVRAYEKNSDDLLPGNFSDVYSDVTLPGQVSLTNVSATGTSSVKLVWKEMSGATGYMIYRKDAATVDYKQIATVKNAKTVSYSDQKLAEGKKYTYKVCAYKVYNKKEYKGQDSPEVQVTTKKTEKPAKPAKVKSIKLSTKNAAVTVQWSKVSGATGYQVYRLNTKTGKYTKIAAIKGTSYQNMKLKKGATYRYKVRAYKTVNKKNYYGVFSDAASIKVK